MLKVVNRRGKDRRVEQTVSFQGRRGQRRCDYRDYGRAVTLCPPLPPSLPHFLSNTYPFLAVSCNLSNMNWLIGFESIRQDLLQLVLPLSKMEKRSATEMIRGRKWTAVCEMCQREWKFKTITLKVR